MGWDMSIVKENIKMVRESYYPGYHRYLKLEQRPWLFFGWFCRLACGVDLCPLHDVPGTTLAAKQQIAPLRSHVLTLLLTRMISGVASISVVRSISQITKTNFVCPNIVFVPPTIAVREALQDLCRRRCYYAAIEV